MLMLFTLFKKWLLVIGINPFIDLLNSCENILVGLTNLFCNECFFYFRKKSDAGKIPALKALTKKSTTPKSPNLAKKRQTSPDNVGTTPKTNLTTLSVTAPSDEMVHRSTEDLESVSCLLWWCYIIFLLTDLLRVSL